jgi:hypothetical protein
MAEHPTSRAGSWPTVLVLVAITAGMSLTGCGIGDGATADTGSGDQPTVVGSAEVGSADRSTPDDLARTDLGAEPASTPASTPAPTGDPTPQAVDATVPTEPDPAEPPPTSTAPAGAPVTTVAGGGAGSTALYQGVLGRLGPDEQVVAAVAAQPSAGPNTMPLTGLPGTPPNRPALVAKIDNGGPARPQTGLNAADVVIEEEVEGGLTRLAAIFHSTPSEIGPIRSARTTDIAVVNGLANPLFVYSGANDVTDTLIRAQPVQNRSAASSSGYWRSSARRAPSNLYSETDRHWASATGGPPPALFSYRPAGVDPGGVADDAVTVAYRSNRVEWRWDGTAWRRRQGGRDHTDASGAVVTAANVVVIETEAVATGMVDGSGSTVPEFVFVGSGRAVVYTAGRRLEGTWTRPSLGQVATLTDATGAVIALTPGRTWVELVRHGTAE